MRTINYIIVGISFLFFLCGVALKWLHLTGGNELLLLTPLPPILLSIIYLVRFFKTNLFQAVSYLLGSLITLYLATRLIFLFYYSKIILIVCIGLLVAGILLLVMKKEKIGAFQILCLVYALIMFYVATFDNSRLYHSINLWGEITEYRSWDHYSFYLYKEGKLEEAQAANQKALEIFDLDKEANYDDRKILLQNAEQIKMKTWTEYSSLRGY